jgi:hypothetical protein
LFISEPIEVTIDEKLRTPVEFTWRGQSLGITEIIVAWQDWNFAGGVSKPTWRQRRHRNYYQVKCDDQIIYEIYLDRGLAGEPKWFLYRIIEDAVEGGPK